MIRDAIRYLGIIGALRYWLGTRQERNVGVHMHPLDWKEANHGN